MLSRFVLFPVISIHAPREGSDVVFDWLLDLGKISIHAPREGSDLTVNLKRQHRAISIHAPREGSDG